MCNLSRRSALGILAGVSTLAFGLPQTARADAAPVDLPKPGPRDTCPVCGMFVARYPEWIATVVFADGMAFHFDGPKDFFKFVQDVVAIFGFEYEVELSTRPEKSIGSDEDW
ncbi:hypothetical protein EOM89_14700, partial [Candidatus Falkowbacteria bacterium]|nr:hypothetical protein [Candidatus Falkowbacteria bacterium]